jgi:hypothetical protein
MPKDSISYNLLLIPKDEVSFFKKFIIIQDEVSLSINVGSSEYSCFEKTDSIFKKKIVQKKLSNTEVYKKSLFTEHILPAFSKNPQNIITNNSDWLLGVFILCFVLVASAKVFFSRRLGQILKAFISPTSINQLARDGNIFNESISFILSAVFFISLSVLICEGIQHYLGPKFLNTPNYILFGVVLLFLLFFYLIKKVLIKTIGFIFHTKRESRDYQLNTLIFNIIAGLFILPISFLLYYSPPNEANWLFLFSVVVLGLVVIYRLFRSFMIGISLSKFSVFYLLLYLCIVEILPILIILKVIKSN